MRWKRQGKDHVINNQNFSNKVKKVGIKNISSKRRSHKIKRNKMRRVIPSNKKWWTWWGSVLSRHQNIRIIQIVQLRGFLKTRRLQGNIVNTWTDLVTLIENLTPFEIMSERQKDITLIKKVKTFNIIFLCSLLFNHDIVLQVMNFSIIK